MSIFQNADYEEYFRTLFGVKNLGRRKDYFDFRPASIKRREFNKAYKQIVQKLIRRDGKSCQWKLPKKCLGTHGLQVDHLIPLSSNVLNKSLHHLKAKPGKKVPSESFGSNNLCNLVLACKECNGFKKHRIFPFRDILLKR